MSLGLIHPVKDKINETLFLANFDIFLSDVKNQVVLGEALCEIKTVAKVYAERVKQTPSDRSVEKAR